MNLDLFFKRKQDNLHNKISPLYRGLEAFLLQKIVSLLCKFSEKILENKGFGALGGVNRVIFNKNIGCL